MPVSWISNSLVASASLLARMMVLPPEVKKPTSPGPVSAEVPTQRKA